MLRTTAPISIFDSILIASQHLTSGNEGRPNSSTFTTQSAFGKSEGKPRALVVDDAPDVLEMIAFLLQHEGYEVVTAESAFDALEAARTAHFDVVVSDIGMPTMSGYELATALREMPEYRSVPKIAVTGFSQYDDTDRALESGFTAHLTKPINPMALLDLIARLRD